MQLGSLARLIRSKNAGPFLLTIDILFEENRHYERVKKSGKLNKSKIALLYQLREEQIQIYECDQAKAIKISFPRNVSAGSRFDLDVFGGQQHSPLIELDI
ncbi:DUF4387 domain-containing protein [Shouchella shacheensis]|uniref:DUF4387 domain-containing protein n=1 Tax=Shouchella shacheensis TaxID=1649580 RepID=UPI0007400860|nr:DUF4387 domain-containing protein [Shouchella shacheensis]